MSWRESKSSTQRGYGYKWQQARKTFLQVNPLCCMCKQDGRIEAATVVDHIEPHRGDRKLFWDRKNWQPLCKTHHDSTKAKEEARGVVIGGDVTGQPLDPDSHWYK